MTCAAPRRPAHRGHRACCSSNCRPRQLPQLAQIYTETARFKDPFNEVQGVPAIRAIFEHMFRTLDAPRFIVHDTVVQGQQCFPDLGLRLQPERAAGCRRWWCAAART